MATLTMEDE